MASIHSPPGRSSASSAPWPQVAATVIISTHVVEAVPGLCNRAVLLAEGRIARDWDARQLAEASRTPGAFEAEVMQALSEPVCVQGS